MICDLGFTIYGLRGGGQYRGMDQDVLRIFVGLMKFGLEQAELQTATTKFVLQQLKLMDQLRRVGDELARGEGSEGLRDEFYALEKSIDQSGTFGELADLIARQESLHDQIAAALGSLKASSDNDG